MKERPKLDYATIKTLWKPDFATDVIRSVNVSKGCVKPSAFRFQLHPSATEAQKYTLELLHRFSEYAFGTTNFPGIPARQRIWTANVAWIRYNVPLGKGATPEEMERFVSLYSEHLLEDNP